MNVPALISEVDSTWLKAQQRGYHGPVRHLPVHLGLHYTGRQRRYRARGSTSVRPALKPLLARPTAWNGWWKAKPQFKPKPALTSHN